jgi:hypothetical protein
MNRTTISKGAGSHAAWSWALPAGCLLFVACSAAPSGGTGLAPKDHDAGPGMAADAAFDALAQDGGLVHGSDAGHDAATSAGDGGSSGSSGYTLPNDDTDCPDDCRQIPWKAGSDLWNGGKLPTYSSVTCTGLAGNGTTDDSHAMQTCINDAASGTAVFLPAGTYFVNNQVALKSNVVLRGAGATTKINLGANGGLTTQDFSPGVDGLTPPVSYGCNPTPPGGSCIPYLLSGSPKKGDTTVTISTGSVTAGQWISITSDDDPSLVNATGTDGYCEWCGANNGYETMQQIVQVTAVSGSTLTLSRPLYYTLFTNPAYRLISFGTEKAGFEYFHATATGDIGSNQIIYLQGCLDCWVKGVETTNTGSSSGSAHIEMDYCYGAEIRDSYVHDGRSSASGANYGIYMNFVNTDAKIENNIMRHNRHGFVFQGGGDGVAVLYNYIDDLYTDDLTYLGSARTSHGAHPYMNLFEGNVASHIAGDDFLGSSSHAVFFRNWMWGDETGDGVPSFPPEEGFDAVDLYTGQGYYSYVGNVLGLPATDAIPTGANASCEVTSTMAPHTTWSAATLTGFNEYAEAPSPEVYSYGGSLGATASSSTTVLRNGNYDYRTLGVAYWDRGSTNNPLMSSYYYSSKPSFFGGCAWPAEGYDLTPITHAIPAEVCYLNGPASGGSFDPATCYP